MTRCMLQERGRTMKTKESKPKRRQANVTLTIDGKQYTYPEGTPYREITKDFEEDFDRKILLVMEGSRLRELHHRAHEDAQITFVRYSDPAGYKAYQRSMCLLMLKAVDYIGFHDPKYEVAIHFAIGDSLYCTVKDPSAITEDFLQRVEKYMKELSARAIQIRKKNVSTAEAMATFHSKRMFDKEQVFRYRLSSRANLYDLEGFVDYYYGYMVYDTSYLKMFSLRRYENGFLLTCPARREPEVMQPFALDRKLFEVQLRSEDWGQKIQVEDVGDLNDKIVAGGFKDLVLMQEAYHEMQIAKIAGEIASDPRRRLIMIAGPSSSGKTTFSHRLSTQLAVHGLRPHPIPVDDYFVDRDKTPLNEDGTYNFECLEALDVELFNKDMTSLLEGKETELPTFNFKTGKREYKGKTLRLGKDDIMVIEGIHGLNDRLSYSLPMESKYKIYISALTQLNIDEHNRISTTDGRLLRRIIRDARTRGSSASETIAMWPSVRRGEEQYIFPFQESADIMFNSALIYELAVLKVYAQSLLFGIDQESMEFTEAKRLLKFLDYFVPVAPDQIPNNSLIREFIGGSCFDV